MAPLSFAEKRSLTKIVSAKAAELQAGGLSFTEKRAATKALNEAVAKLTGAMESGKSTPLLDALLAGQFNDLEPLPFLAKLEDVVKELEGDVEPVKPAVIAYVEKNTQGVTDA